MHPLTVQFILGNFKPQDTGKLVQDDPSGLSPGMFVTVAFGLGFALGALIFKTNSKTGV